MTEHDGDLLTGSRAATSRYVHSSVGYGAFAGIALGAAVLFSVYNGLREKAGSLSSSNTTWIVIGPGVLVLAAAAIVFYRLRIEVSAGVLSWSFGPGFFRGEMRASDITRSTIVRNPWYYGWGIRLTPVG